MYVCVCVCVCVCVYIRPAGNSLEACMSNEMNVQSTVSAPLFLSNYQRSVCVFVFVCVCVCVCARQPLAQAAGLIVTSEVKTPGSDFFQVCCRTCWYQQVII